MSFGFGFGDAVDAYHIISKLRNRFIHAPNQFRAVSDEAINLARILKDVGDLETGLSDQQRTEFHNIENTCHQNLNRIQNELNKFSDFGGPTKGSSIWIKFRIAWKRTQWDVSTAQDLREQINHQHTLLISFNTRIILAQLSQAHGREILDWISTADYLSQHVEHCTRRSIGTGKWLLEDVEFKSWVSTKGSGLLCYGAAGAGKSTMASLIIDHLRHNHRDQESTGIAYLYCEHGRSFGQNYTDLIAALLRQVCEQRPSIPKNVVQLHERHEQGRSPPSVDELSDMLEGVISKFSAIYVVIDALDECHELARATLMARLADMQARYGLCILATSRYPQALANADGYKKVEIRAKDADINAYLQENLPTLRHYVSLDKDLLEEIQKQIVRAADGIFLLAYLYFQSVAERAGTPGAVRKMLRDLPTSPRAYNGEYDKRLAKIRGQSTETRARDILTLVSCAKRPLSIAELQHALAAEIGEAQPGIDDISKPEDLILDGAGLISVETGTGVVRLFHQTVFQYLKYQQWFPNAEKALAEAAVAYLSFEDFAGGRCSTDDDFEKRLGEHPFFDYAARHWGSHVRSASLEEDDAVLNLLQDENKVLACSQAMLVPTGFKWRGYSQRAARNVTGAHLAAFFGLGNALKRMAARGMSLTSTDSQARSPLSWAAEKGDPAICQLLLGQAGQGLDKKDRFGRTELLWAAIQGHQEIVNLLLSTGKVDADSQDEESRTALSWAASNDHTSIAQLLVQIGSADVNLADFDGRTPLSWAAEQGSESTVRWLLQTRLDTVDARDHFGRTALSRAAENGFDRILETFLSVSKIGITFEDNRGRNPLAWAAMNGHIRALQKLLQTGAAHPDACDDLGRTPLLWAAENGHKEVFEFLLQTGQVNATTIDSKDRSAFHLAARNGHEDLLRYLLGNPALETIFDLQDVGGRTPLSWAAGNGHKAAVQLLLNHGGVNPDSLDNESRTPLSRAAENGHDDIAGLLLNTGAVEKDSRDRIGRTPLLLAAEDGHEALVRQLVHVWQADIDIRDRKRQTALSLAEQAGHGGVTKFLLEEIERRKHVHDTSSGQ